MAWRTEPLARALRAAVPPVVALAVLFVSGHAPAAPKVAKPQAPAKASPPQPAKGSPGQGKGKPGKKAKPEPPIPKGYANSVRAWHAAIPGKSAPNDDRGRPKLVLFALNTQERVELTALSDTGGFSGSDLERAAQLLRDPRTGNEHPVEPRLLDSVYRIARKFAAHEIRVVSGYRTPKPGTHSNHGRGRAMDLIVPGTTDEDVAKFAREAGFAGVGIYPVSGFVHVDVREHSHFWVDTTGPGRKSRDRGILADVAARSDKAALARGDRPIGPFTLLPDVDGALASREKALGAAHTPSDPDGHPHDEDEDMENVGGGAD
jgi:uncharacterized protein YcbK (DUF882 family)